MRQYTKTYINELLKKFMDGTTTLAEEDVLSNYFLQQRDVPQEWQDYRQLFAELEAMKPQAGNEQQAESRPVRRRWLRWSAAAAVVGILFAAMLWQPAEPTAPTVPTVLTAQDDREDTVLRPEPPNQEVAPDSTALRRMLDKKYPPKRSRRSLRKPEPTITDYDKGYVLMARMQQEQQQVEQQIAQTRQEIIRAQLTAAGYVAIQQEDGTIIYIDEPKEYFAYEE